MGQITLNFTENNIKLDTSDISRGDILQSIRALIMEFREVSGKYSDFLEKLPENLKSTLKRMPDGTTKAFSDYIIAKDDEMLRLVIKEAKLDSVEGGE